MTGLSVDMRAEREGFEVDVAFTVDDGAVAALIGPNGAGKSTVVDAIAGLVGIDSGRIRIGGDVVDDPMHKTFVPARLRRLGVVFQDRVLFPHLSAVENVAFGLTGRGVAGSEAVARAHGLLDELGLGEVALRNVTDLSGGEAQRVAVARALAIEPRALLLDEPFAALDAAAKVEVRRQIAQHIEAFPGPVILVTHDPAEAFILADEVHVIEGGRITQQGTPDEIRLRPRTRYVAEFAGTNLLRGVAANGDVDLTDHRLRIADRAVAGPVIVSIQPSAIAVHRSQPGGSPRNAWRTGIDAMEVLGDRVRLHVGAPLPLTVEVTPGAVDALELDTASPVWLSIKATEIGVLPG